MLGSGLSGGSIFCSQESGEGTIHYLHCTWLQTQPSIVALTHIELIFFTDVQHARSLLIHRINVASQSRAERIKKSGVVGISMLDFIPLSLEIP